MGSKINCYTCEHFRPLNDSTKGLCMILDDLAGEVYYVDSKSKECLYNLTKMPVQLTLQEAKLRDYKASIRRKNR